MWSSLWLVLQHTGRRQEEVSIYSGWKDKEHIVVVGTEKCLILFARFLLSTMTPFVGHNIAFSEKAIQIKGNNILSHSLSVSPAQHSTTTTSERRGKQGNENIHLSGVLIKRDIISFAHLSPFPFSYLHSPIHPQSIECMSVRVICGKVRHLLSFGAKNREVDRAEDTRVIAKKASDLPPCDVQSYDQDIIEQWRVDYSCARMVGCFVYSFCKRWEIGISFAPLSL